MAIATGTLLAGAALASAGASTYNSISQANAAKKAVEQQANQAQVNTDSLATKTAELSKQNALASAELERQLTPEVQQLRTASNQRLLGGLSDGRYGMDNEASLIRGQLGTQFSTPLLKAAIAKAQADLSLGGNLSQDVQNMATRRALAQAGTVGGGLGLGRDLVARDLGLTSLQLEQQRLQNASQLGGQELQLGQSNAANFLNQIQLLNALNQGGFGRDLATAQYAESIQRPIVGLDPGSAANLQIANQNAQGAAAANLANINGQQNQNYINGIGQVGGALLAFNQANQQPQQQVPSFYNQPYNYQAGTGTSPYPYIQVPTT